MNILEKLSDLVYPNQSIQSVIPEQTPNQKYPDEVAQIHHAFEIAGDALLVEAQKTLDALCEKSCEKGQRLTKIGFTQAKEAVEASKVIADQSKAKKIYDCVMRYKVNYPNKQFITEDQVKQICEKWNLVKGDIGQFKGFVPEKNLQEIESFQIKKEDVGLSLSNGLFLKRAKVTKHNDYWHIYKLGAVINYDNRAFQSNDGISFYASDTKNIFGLNHKGDMNFTVANSLQICAPLQDMNTNGYNISGYKLIKHVPDPVVLQTVDGGYIVITKWGDEASDPALNEINN